MGYKVLVRFMDLEDNNFIYEEGWDFPRANHFVNKQRIEELASSENRQGMPLIIESGEVKKSLGDTVDEIVMPIEEPVNDGIVEEIKEEVVELEEKPKKKTKKK